MGLQKIQGTGTVEKCVRVLCSGETCVLPEAVRTRQLTKICKRCRPCESLGPSCQLHPVCLNASPAYRLGKKGPDGTAEPNSRLPLRKQVTGQRDHSSWNLPGGCHWGCFNSPKAWAGHEGKISKRSECAFDFAPHCRRGRSQRDPNSPAVTVRASLPTRGGEQVLQPPPLPCPLHTAHKAAIPSSKCVPARPGE